MRMLTKNAGYVIIRMLICYYLKQFISLLEKVENHGAQHFPEPDNDFLRLHWRLLIAP